MWDFSGYATKNDLICGDGRTIRKDAFKDCDGETVPLVWNHDYSGPDNVLGHALLENREDGVYAYCSFNDSESGQAAKEAVKHGDVKSLSIFANHLKQDSKRNVLHGTIRELSLVLAGANPGAKIDFVMAHSDDGEEYDSELYASYDENIMLYHSEDQPADNKDEKVKMDEKAPENKGENEETVGDVINTMTDKQKKVLYALIADSATNNNNSEKNKEETEMKQNAFENNNGGQNDDVIRHSEEFVHTMIGDAKRQGSMKESFLAHAEEYGIENLEYLFPEAKTLNNVPEFIQRNNDWVRKVMSKVHRSPMSRIKSIFADITEDDARAKGYIKGKLKKEEVFSLLKRTTTPTTVYKKQKMDRDDIVDITDIDTINWLKSEMRMMLDEEIARDILIGDGRLASSDDKINEQCIRPVLNDNDLFVIRWSVSGSDESEKAKNFIKACIKARKNYKGSGNPDLYTTEDMLTEMLLLEDTIGHRIYKTEAELATALRVKEIITVPVMEDLTDKDQKDVYGIIINLNDYNVGADKGGAINMFDDFDIDYNQQKYLIETRCSGALIKPFSAIVLRSGDSTASEEPTMAVAKASIGK